MCSSDLAIATAPEIDELETEAKKFVSSCRRKAWDEFMNPIKQEISTVCELFDRISVESQQAVFVQKIKE